MREGRKKTLQDFDSELKKHNDELLKAREELGRERKNLDDL